MKFALTAINVTRPQFDGTLMGHSSFVSLSLPPFYRDHFELKFHFVTDDARQVALLFFIGQPVGAEEKDFLAVSFIRGHVALTWDLGSGARRIFTARPVAVNTMGGHSVHVGRRGRVAWLQVNNQPTVTGRSPGLNSALNANPQLFLGEFLHDFRRHLVFMNTHTAHVVRTKSSAELKSFIVLLHGFSWGDPSPTYSTCASRNTPPIATSRLARCYTAHEAAPPAIASRPREVDSLGQSAGRSLHYAAIAVGCCSVAFHPITS